MAEPLLQIKNLQKKYPIYGPLGKMFPPVNHMRAVADVSLNVYEGETYGLVGESGCGKSTTGRSVLGLVKPDSGEILYNGKDLTKLNDAEFRPLRADLQMVFQDTLSSLNPRSRIGDLLEEPMIIQNIGTPAERRQKVLDVLTMVGLSEEHYFRYPHELSGGQVQRLGIARAMIINPKLIICDEPVSALDVSIQSQILNMLTRLQREMNLSLLFISHDIGVVRYIGSVSCIWVLWWRKQRRRSCLPTPCILTPGHCLNPFPTLRRRNGRFPCPENFLSIRITSRAVSSTLVVPMPATSAVSVLLK